MLRLRRSISFTADSSRPASEGPLPRQSPEASRFLLSPLYMRTKPMRAELNPSAHEFFPPSTNVITQASNAESIFTLELAHWEVAELILEIDCGAALFFKQLSMADSCPQLPDCEKAKGLEAVLRLRGSVSSTVDSSRPASEGPLPRQSPEAWCFLLNPLYLRTKPMRAE